MTKITYSVMAHPARAEYHPYLEQYFDRWAVDYESKGPWENRKKAHRMYDSNSDYHFVIQDDALLCTDFFDEVQDLVEAYPGYVYSLFANLRLDRYLRKRRGHAFDRTVVFEGGTFNGVAFGLPIEHIEPYLKYGDSKKMRQKLGPRRGDETRLRFYQLEIGLPTVYPFPCLVEHRLVPSVMGNGVHEKRTAFLFKG